VAWYCSGIPALQRAIAHRITTGTGAALLQRIGASAKNIASGLQAADVISTADAGARNCTSLSAEEAQMLMRSVSADHIDRLRAEFDSMLETFAERLHRVQDSFLERATASMIEHLDNFGVNSPWTYDPAGLRVLLSSSHKVLARNASSAFEKATQAVAADFADIYLRAFSIGAKDMNISLPRPPSIPAPVTLGRTIALDLSAGWWKRWWLQRRGYRAYAQSFHDLIKSETNPVVSELRDDLAQGVRSDALGGFEAFISEQMSVFETLDRMQRASPEELRNFVAKHSPHERRALFERTLETLDEYATT
jgi:ElaB/YqjD/DUF883 family membrane-anchored ribosome-binding protein